MQELTDDQLDGLFRKSLEEADPLPDLTNDAWAGMARQLDAHNRRQIWQRWLRWGGRAGILLLLIGTGWLVTHRPSQTAGKKQEAVAGAEPVSVLTDGADRTGVIDPAKPLSARRGTNQPIARDALSAAGPDSPAPDRQLQSGTTDLPGRRVARESAEQNPETEIDRAPTATSRPTGAERRLSRLTTPAKRTGLNQRKTAETDAPALAPLLTPTTGSVAERLPIDRAGRRGNRRVDANWTPAVAVSDIRSPGGGIENGDSVGNESASASGPPDQRNLLPVLTTVASHTALTLLSVDPLRRQPESPVVAEQPGRQPQPISVRGPSIQFVVSPDLSGVGLRNFSRPGTNLGLMLDYRLASRWSVQAGALWSIKRYEARTSDYTWPAHTYWKVKPESVSGECRMIDIPLNIRYDVVSRPRNGRFDRWFVSSGLTSYVILEEEYNYNYAKPNDPAIVNRSTYVDSTSRFGFSQLNLSAGYERAISQRLAWQVEPFLKVSLKGVGVYKVHLLSTGVFLSLRYRL